MQSVAQLGENSHSFYKIQPDLAGKYKKSCASCAGRCDPRVPVRVPQLGTQQPGGGTECPRLWRCHPGTRPGPVPPGAAQELLLEIQELLSSQIRLCLHCSQSLTYCRHSMLWFCVCWVLLSAAGWKESSSLPGYTGCCRYLPCQGHTPRAGRQAGSIAILRGF